MDIFTMYKIKVFFFIAFQKIPQICSNTICTRCKGHVVTYLK